MDNNEINNNEFEYSYDKTAKRKNIESAFAGIAAIYIPMAIVALVSRFFGKGCLSTLIALAVLVTTIIYEVRVYQLGSMYSSKLVKSVVFYILSVVASFVGVIAAVVIVLIVAGTNENMIISGALISAAVLEIVVFVLQAIAIRLETSGFADIVRPYSEELSNEWNKVFVIWVISYAVSTIGAIAGVFFDNALLTLAFAIPGAAIGVFAVIKKINALVECKVLG